MEGVNEGGGGDARGGVGLQLGLGVAEGDCGLVSERGEMLCVGDLLRERGGFVEAAWHTWFYVNIVACFLKFSSAYTSAIPSPSSCFSSSRRFSFNRRSWQLAISTASQEDNGNYLSTDFSAVELGRNRGPTSSTRGTHEVSRLVGRITRHGGDLFKTLFLGHMSHDFTSRWQVHLQKNKIKYAYPPLLAIRRISKR